MNPMNPELRFPKPPFRVDQSLLDVPPPNRVIASYRDEIRQWRLAVLEFLCKSRAEAVAPVVEGLSERARWWLDQFLAASWSEEITRWAVNSPYNLCPYPASALEAASTSTLVSILEVLCWRAGVQDCLCDIWDVIGYPLLDFEECGAIGQFLYPACEERICLFCLTEFSSADHRCLLLGHVRAKWPATPPAFKRWKIEAAQQD